MSQELLTSKEYATSVELKEPADLELNAPDVNTLADLETQILESLRPVISRKLRFTLEEKLKNQKQELQRLLGLDKNLADNKSKYSNVLDSQYFEQIFLN